MDLRSDLPKVRAAIAAAGAAGLTVKQICEQVGCSKATAWKHISYLKEQGWLAEDALQERRVGKPAKLFYARKAR